MLEINQKILEQCYQHGLEAYPEEACGLISGSKENEGHLSEVHRMKNVMDEYHAKDPQLYPRTNKNAYTIDPREQMKLERCLKKEGKRVKIIYHSHPDVGAYFSETDHADALWNGDPRYPGISYLICGISKEALDGAILVTFNSTTGTFDITKIQ